MPTVNRARIRNDLGRDRKRLDPQYAKGLRIAVVRRVDYEAMTVDLMAVGQGNDDQYLSVPLTFPAAGRRNFMGVMPEIHDNCVIGFAPREGDRFKQPYILAWLPPGTLPGYNWITTSTHDPDELAMDPATKFQLEGVFGQIRHKLRHLAPGNAFISSSQGSDLVLDESAHLTNRRGNEVILRDQDQALVVRTLQQFHAGAGFRIYGGIVQRDARLLQTTMVGNGKDYTGPQQVSKDGVTLTPSQLPNSDLPVGAVLGDPVFDADSDVAFDSFINPYTQLELGKFTQGRIVYTSAPTTSDAVSGGKPIYRLGLVDTTSGLTGSAAANTAIPSLTEYRIEIAHTTDGTLPVTEQTDGFDVDRIPEGTTPDEATNNPPNPNRAFVEFVLGTAVENDLMSPLYGFPLTTQIFVGDNVAPSVYSAEGLGVPDQLAVFLRVKDPTSAVGDQAFVSITKGGTWRSALTAGELLFTEEHSLAARNSFFTTQQVFSVKSTDGRAEDNLGVSITSDNGAVYISAGGSTTAGLQGAAANGTESSLPGLILNSQTNTLIQAQRAITLSAPTVNLQNADTLAFRTGSTFAVNSGGAANITAKTISVTSTGRATYSFGGPLESQSTNAPLRLTKFTAQPSTGFVSGTVDDYSIEYGDLVETIKTGSRKTKVTTGDILFETVNGTAEMKSSQNTVTLKKDSIAVTAKQGSVNIEASTDAMTLLATRNLLLKSRQGVEINGPTISFAVLGADFPGGVLTDGCIDGLTGQPFRNGGTFGSNQVRMTTATS